MKTKSVTLGLAVVLIIIYSGCKKDVAIVTQPNHSSQTNNTGTLNSPYLSGKWKWQYTFRVWTQDTLKPSVVGYTRELLFLNDTAYFYKNGTIDGVSKYSLSYEKHSSNDSVLYITFLSSLNGINEKGNRIDTSGIYFKFDDRIVDGNLVVYYKEN